MAGKDHEIMSMVIYIVLFGGVPPFFETSVTNHGRVLTGPSGPVLRPCDTRSLLLPFPFPSPDVQVWTSGHLAPPASVERGRHCRSIGHGQCLAHYPSRC